MTPSPELAPEVAAALRELPPGLDPLARARHLRRTLAPELARVAGAQAELRERAAGKLAHAERLLLTRVGLEQATDRRVAARRAERIARHAEAAGAWVVDATCGIGGDVLELAAAGALRLVCADKDARTAALVRRNLDELGHPARVLCAAAERLPLARGLERVLLLDPDRRRFAGAGTGVGRQRRSRPEEWSPPWARCVELLAGAPAGCAKLAPAADAERLAAALPSGLARSFEWVSLAGELKELCLWTGALADAPDLRTAVAIAPDGTARTFRARVADSPAPASHDPRWIAEPDPAVIRAGLVGALAREDGLAPLAPEIAYLGGERAPGSPLLRSWRVLGATSLDRRRVRALLGQHDVGPLTVKKRGHPDDAQTLARRLRGSGARRGLLIVARLENGHRAFLVAEAEPAGGPGADRSTRDGPDPPGVSSPR